MDETADANQIVRAHTRALEKTPWSTAFYLAQEYIWSDLFWHKAAGGIDVKPKTNTLPLS